MSLAPLEQPAQAASSRKSHPARRNMKTMQHLAISALTLSAIVLSGCAGATRLPARAKGPAGETLQTKHIDLSFLEAPGTQREDVLKRLSTVDTAYSNPRLFWGRWSDS